MYTFCLLELSMDIFVCDATRMLTNEHKLSINIYETFMVIHGHLCDNICSRNPFRRISARETTCCSSRNDFSLSNPKISSHNLMFNV